MQLLYCFKAKHVYVGRVFIIKLCMRGACNARAEPTVGECDDLKNKYEHESVSCDHGGTCACQRHLCAHHQQTKCAGGGGSCVLAGRAHTSVRCYTHTFAGGGAQVMAAACTYVIFVAIILLLRVNVVGVCASSSAYTHADDNSVLAPRQLCAHVLRTCQSRVLCDALFYVP
jgi:hypothetical protein